MHKIPLKPLSVNQAYQGRRYRTRAYKAFISDALILLNHLKPEKPRGESLMAHYRWGVSSRQSDTDNPTKTFQDTLFDYWGMKTQDSKVEFIILEKVWVKKGEEFISFHVDSHKHLATYLQELSDERKGKSKH